MLFRSLQINNTDVYVNGNVRMNATSTINFGVGNYYSHQGLSNALNGNTVIGTGSVSIDLLKVMVSNSGNRSLQFTRASGVSDFSFIGTIEWSFSNQSLSMQTSGSSSTSWQYFAPSHNFNGNGDLARYTITDTTNSKTYRITVVYISTTHSSIIIERIA